MEEIQNDKKSRALEPFNKKTPSLSRQDFDKAMQILTENQYIAFEDTVDKVLDVMTQDGWMVPLKVEYQPTDQDHKHWQLNRTMSEGNKNINTVSKRRSLSIYLLPTDTFTVPELKTLLAQKLGIPEKEQKLYYAERQSDVEENGTEGTPPLLYGDLLLRETPGDAINQNLGGKIVLERFQFSPASPAWEAMKKITGFANWDVKALSRLTHNDTAYEQCCCFHGRSLGPALPRTSPEMADDTGDKRSRLCWRCHGTLAEKSFCCRLSPFRNLKLRKTSRFPAANQFLCCPVEVCESCMERQDQLDYDAAMEAAAEAFRENEDEIDFDDEAEEEQEEEEEVDEEEEEEEEEEGEEEAQEEEEEQEEELEEEEGELAVIESLKDSYQDAESFLLKKYAKHVEHVLEAQKEQAQAIFFRKTRVKVTLAGFQKNDLFVPPGMTVEVHLSMKLQPAFHKHLQDPAKVPSWNVCSTTFPTGATMQEFLNLVQKTWIKHLIPGFWKAMEASSSSNLKRWEYFFRGMAKVVTWKVIECSTLDRMVLEVSHVNASQLNGMLSNLFRVVPPSK